MKIPEGMEGNYISESLARTARLREKGFEGNFSFSVKQTKNEIKKYLENISDNGRIVLLEIMAYMR
jgi:hypothetical protein